MSFIDRVLVHLATDFPRANAQRLSCKTVPSGASLLTLTFGLQQPLPICLRAHQCRETRSTAIHLATSDPLPRRSPRIPRKASPPRPICVPAKATRNSFAGKPSQTKVQTSFSSTCNATIQIRSQKQIPKSAPPTIHKSAPTSSPLETSPLNNLLRRTLRNPQQSASSKL